MSRFRNYYNRTSLITKMVVLIVMMSIGLFTVMDYIEKVTVKERFEAHFREMLNEKALEFRLQFSRLVHAHTQATQIFVSQINLIEYIKAQDWSEGTIDVKSYSRPPLWFPPVTVLRTFSNPRHAVLVDISGRVRELYNSGDEALPLELAAPTRRLLKVTQNVSYLTSFDGKPYLATSEQVRDASGHVIATLMLASPFDEDFLAQLQSFTKEKFIVALVSDAPEKILISSRSELIKAGMAIEDLRDSYIVLMQEFFEYGSSNMTFKFVSLLDRKVVAKFVAPFVLKDRLQNLFQAGIFLALFVLILYTITSQVLKMQNRVKDFSKEALGEDPDDLRKGDELYLLEMRFQELTEAVLQAQDRLKRDAEERLDLMRKYAELEHSEKQLNLLQSITETLGVGVIMKDPKGEYELNEKMQEFVKLSGDVSPFELENGLRDEKIIPTSGGHDHIFDVMKADVPDQDQVLLVQDITKRRMAEEKIKASLREKDVLLAEIHHRVKNNMAVISSILRLQSSCIDDEKYRNMFKESQSRINSMALVHEKLYQTEDFTRIDMDDYVLALVQSIRNTFRSGREYYVNTEIDDIDLQIDILIPCGMIINEILTNSFKYAFDDEQKAEIDVIFKRREDSKIALTISDNGRGMPEGFDIDRSSGLGLQIVNSLVEQIDGALEISSGQGAKFELVFPDKLEYARHCADR